MSRTSRKPWLAFGVLVVLLVAGTTMPGALKSDIEGQMWHAIPWSHLAHFVLFGLIAACPVYGQGRGAVWRAIAIAIALAVLTELLQSLVPGRHPTLRDVLIDLGGAVTGIVARRFLSPVTGSAQAP